MSSCMGYFLFDLLFPYQSPLRLEAELYDCIIELLEFWLPGWNPGRRLKGKEIREYFFLSSLLDIPVPLMKYALFSTPLLCDYSGHSVPCFLRLMVHSPPITYFP